MKRRIVQLTAMKWEIFAVADDGTAWYADRSAYDRTWKQLAPLPQPEAEETKE